MKYLKIELSGYKRLDLSQTKFIRMEPESAIQLILGTNGSGKTAVMREMTVLPSDPNQYYKPGYKLLEVEHNQSIYQLLNKFDASGSVYSMIKDGVELSEGFTATSYRTLIRQEFGITPEIQALVDGITRLSTMDAPKRRYWFTQLSAADYTYAFRYYDNLRKKLRDLQGSYSVTQSRLATELTKLLSPEDEAKIRERIADYRSDIEELLQRKPHIKRLKKDLVQSLDHLSGEQGMITERLGRVIDRLNKLIAWRVTGSHEPLDQSHCKSKMDLLVMYRNSERDEANRLVEILESKHDVIEGAQKLSMVSRHTLAEDRDQTEAQLLRLQRLLTYPDVYPPREGHHWAKGVRSAFLMLQDGLTQAIDGLPVRDLTEISRAGIDLHTQRQTQLTETLASQKTEFDRLHRQREDLNHARTHNQRDCPECHHKWIEGYSERTFLEVVERLQALALSITTNEASLVESQRYLEDAGLYRQYFRRVRELLRSSPVLSALESHVDKNNLIAAAGDLQQLVQACVRDLQYFDDIDRLSDQLVSKNEDLATFDKMSSQDHVKALEQVRLWESKLQSIYGKIRDLDAEIVYYTRLHEAFASVKRVALELEEVMKLREVDMSELTEAIRVDYVNNVIGIIRYELSNLEQQISKIDVQKGVIEQLKDQVKDHESSIRLLKLAERSMSPSKGLIAKGLTGFINYFNGRVNQFVKRIWTYPMEILPIEATDDSLDLDYKFQVRFDNRFTAPDIKHGQCNNSTCEVFDLAYRIVAMELLGLSSHPLQLDEFGASFDPVHRPLAFQVVTNLTTSTDIPQIFMVSHDPQSYGSLKNADVTVLHAENVVIPEGVTINQRTVLR